MIGGYEADSDEVDTIVARLLDDEDLADPTLMYIQATKQMVLHTAVADRLGALRAEAVRRLCEDDDGMSYQATADHLGLSKPRVQQLVAATRTA
jgi:hypothetical protein